MITLGPVAEGDLFLVRRWLRQPEIYGWWGSVTAAEMEINLARQSAVAIARMILADGRPVGYGHAADAALWHGHLSTELPTGAWDLQVFIGDPAGRGQGAGGAAIRLLADEVFQTTLAVACCVVAPIQNERAVRVYEKAGFRWRGVVNGSAGRPSWLLVRDRA